MNTPSQKSLRLRTVLREESSLHSPRLCGVPYGPYHQVLKDDRISLWRKSHFCKSSTFCPVCSVPIREERQRAGRLAARRWAELGRPLVFATLTMSHTVEDALVDLVEVFYRRWSLMSQGRGWDVLRAKNGIKSTQWAQETTWAPSAGWHPHRHLALYCVNPDLDAIRDYLQKHFPGEFAVDVQLARSPEDVLDYINKPQMRGQVEGHYGIDPLILMDEFSKMGDVSLRDLYHEHEQAMTGRRTYSWSNRAKLFAELGISDEDLRGGIPGLVTPGELLKVFGPEEIDPLVLSIPGILDEGVPESDFGYLCVSQWYHGPDPRRNN